MSEKRVIVRILGRDVSYSLFEDIVDRCQQAGLRVDRRMPLLGLISGSIDTDHIPALSSIPNVEVELDVGKHTAL
jgi:hypothetical protein